MAINSLRDDLEKWRGGYAPVQPLSDEVAARQLDARLKGEMREDLLSRFTYNGGPASIRFLASYSDLQSLDRIDEADGVMRIDPLSHASLCRSVFQATEIALLNIAELAGRSRSDIESGHIGEAEEKYRWVSALQRTLAQFSDLLAQLPPVFDGPIISIQSSAAFCDADRALEAVRDKLIDAGLIDGEQIVNAQLHDPARNITHQAFADLVFEDLWKEGLGQIVIPAVCISDTELHYDDFVGTESIRLAVHELDHVGDTFFRQFRAFHQMSEIFAKQANHLLAGSVDELIKEDGSLPKAVAYLNMALAFLAFLPENLNPLLEILSVSRYQEFRESLGITSGAHSPNIRKSLFNSLYPLVVRAVEANVLKTADGRKESLNDRVQQIYENRFEDPQANALVSLCEGTISLHFTLRRWRDLHLQFVKAHLGMSVEAPTASVSGARDGTKTVAQIRENANSRVRDPIVKLYECVHRKPYNEAPPFAPYPSGSFAGKITAQTASLVKHTSAAIEQRVAAMTKTKDTKLTPP